MSKVAFSAKLLFKEPPIPIVSTVIPGPKSLEMLKKINKLQDTRSTFFASDLQGSVGNFIKDADGNLILDLHNQIASLSLGYNNPGLLKAAASPLNLTMLVNRPALGIDPPIEWYEMLESVMKVAPKGMDQVVTSMCGSCANEMAYKAVFMAHQKRARGDKAFTPQELASCMDNSLPGSPNLSILSFRGGFHGRLFGCLSTTRSKAIHKLDIPAFPWPAAPFPQLKYPLEEFTKENAEEEAKCLDAAEKLIKTWPQKVAGMIVEPIQAEGGDNHASPNFFRQLRELARVHQVMFIVDEVQTGVAATGKFWAHEHWNLTHPPDIVTFSKKMQAAGYYTSTDLLRPSQPYRQFNTWMGSPTAVVLLKEIIDQIEKYNLIDHVNQVGKIIWKNLVSTPGLENVRGLGTFLAFDLATPTLRDEFIVKARNLGVNLAGCGDRTVRLRPMLVFDESHAEILNQVFLQVSNSLNR